MKRISFEEPEFSVIVFSSTDVNCTAVSGETISTGDGTEEEEGGDG